MQESDLEVAILHNKLSTAQCFLCDKFLSEINPTGFPTYQYRYQLQLAQVLLHYCSSHLAYCVKSDVLKVDRKKVILMIYL